MDDTTAGMYCYEKAKIMLLRVCTDTHVIEMQMTTSDDREKEEKKFCAASESWLGTVLFDHEVTSHGISSGSK